MRWNRQTVLTLAIGAIAVCFASFMLRWTTDHHDDPPQSHQSVVVESSTVIGAPIGGTDATSGLPLIAESDLPGEARAVLVLIDRGGPYVSPQHDGTVFENREGLLPDEPGGYYHEYTVPTPGEDDRGPRRVITGSGDEFYWTADHYASFERIVRA